MTQTENGFRNNTDKSHYARCIRRLKEWHAPLDGWKCISVIDVREDDEDAPLSTCKLCDCDAVRFEHIMEHDLYFEPVTVGCICAGIMEGDVLKAQERERQMRNRSQRRRNFVRKPWKRTGSYIWFRRYKNQQMLISEHDGRYSVSVGHTTTWKYKGKPIRDFLSATYAAFDLADPAEAME